MNVLAALCIKRPVFATVLILVFTVFGAFAYLELGLDRFPKVDFPIITVTTRIPGSAPEEVEIEVTDKIEKAVNTASGIEEVRSISAEGISQVFVTFVLEKDIDVAAQDVRDKINGVLPDLPKDIDQPTVEKLDPDATPVLALAVSADAPLRDLTEYSDKVLRRQLESIAGVGQVMIVGGQARQVNVYLDPLKLRAHRLTVTDVTQALATQNLQLPGGAVKAGGHEFTVRTMGRVDSVPQMESIAVANRGGHTIRIADLGRVEDGTEEIKSASQLDETPCVLLNIRKQSGTNTVEVVNKVKERLAEIESTRPAGYEIRIVRDQSTFIQAAVHTVEEHLVLGSISAAIVVFFFLANARTTLIAALAIPTSIVSSFAAMYYMGFTLNSITLLALTLSVGIVIDDAIVVMENIFRYIEEKGVAPFEAARLATAEIGLAVMAITLSLVAVFMPIAFMGGIVGRFLKSFGVTMSATIMVSMFVSFTLTPMLAARWLRAKVRHEDEPAPPPGDTPASHAAPAPAAAHGASKSRGFYRVIELSYLGLLQFSLRQRWLVALVVIATLVSVPVLMGKVRKNFLPEDDQAEFQVNIRAPEGTNIEATQVIAARIAREVRRLNGVKYTLTSVADNEQRTANQGTIYVRMVPVPERAFDQLELMNFVRKEILPKFADLNLRMSVVPVATFSGGGMSSGDIQYMIGGRDMKKLEGYARQVMDELKHVPGAVDVDWSLVPGKPQYGVVIDRAKAADLGVNILNVASTLRWLVAGDKATDYNEGGEQYEVHVRAASSTRNRVETLSLVSVPSTKYGTVPLGDVIRFDPGDGPAQIDRLNRVRQITINANLTPNASQQAVLDAIQAATEKLHMEPGYITGLLGKSKELKKTFRGFIMVFTMAFIFIYLVLAAQFESWLHPITILISLPLTLPFALASLLIFNQSLNIFSLLGILVLFAVVKKNSILQIDHTNQLRAAGLSRHDAIVAANLDRLRPILMTTVAFVAGMIPLFVSNGEGAATNRAISGVVIGGQTLSLLLTLLATPVIYSLFDDLGQLRLWHVLGTLPARLAGLFRSDNEPAEGLPARPTADEPALLESPLRLHGSGSRHFTANHEDPLAKAQKDA